MDNFTITERKGEKFIEGPAFNGWIAAKVPDPITLEWVLDGINKVREQAYEIGLHTGVHFERDRPKR